MENFYERPEKDSNVVKTERELPNVFAKAAQILGIVAVVSALTCTIYLPVIFASLAIIMACLSKVDKKMHSSARLGIQLSIASIAINAVILFFTLGIILGSGKMHDSFNQSFKEIYGQSFDEIMEDINSGDFDEEDFYEKILGNANR